VELIKSTQRACRVEVATASSVKLATIVSRAMSNSPVKLQGPVVAAIGLKVNEFPCLRDLHVRDKIKPLRSFLCCLNSAALEIYGFAFSAQRLKLGRNVILRHKCKQLKV